MASTTATTTQTLTTDTGPAIHVTNGEAGASTFAGSESRDFNYFAPRGRRATIYEDVTVDVQPDPERHLLQGWVYSFADGRPSYGPMFTKLQATDWHVFRDPNEQWNRNIYIREGNTVRQIQKSMAIAKKENAFANWDRSGVEVVQTHVSATAHPEHWLGMHVFMKAQRDAPTNMINNASAVACMDKLRNAQDLTLYNLELTDLIQGFDGTKARQAWLSDPIWQGVRENVERLAANNDWAEQTFAANVIYEPLVGELFRSNFVMQFAAPHGDFVTPTLIGVGEYDFENNLTWTMALYRLLVEDAQHGESNRKLLRDWLREWVPLSVTAARKLQPLWSQPKHKVLRFEDAYDRAKNRFESLLAELRLELPAGVNL